ncbi:MAG: M17 family peptidase N-terminal domain-containing protein, partial [Jatrophihabitans sp.]
MTSVFLSKAGDPVPADVVVLASVATGDGAALAAGSAGVDAALGGHLGNALRALEATGRTAEVSRIAMLDDSDPDLVLVIGIGRTGG